MPALPEPLSVPLMRLDADLDLPAAAHSGDAGLDLRARTDAVIPAGGGRVLMPTGIAIALPIGTAALVLPRSGLALHHGVSVLNAPGLIDAGYRGEIKVILINTDPTIDYTVQRGDRIAQLMIHTVVPITWQEVTSLDGEDRGGGFGHSGRR